MAQDDTTPLLLLGGGIAAWYFWPQISAALGIQTSATTTAPAAPRAAAPAPPGAQMTNSTPATGAAGATLIPNSNGCYTYNNLISCPPGVTPPAGAAPINNCQPGYAVDANGVCTLYSDAALLAGLNSIQWSGVSQIPAEQLQRIDPQILAQYGATTGVTPGSVLAYMLGLGGSASIGTIETGSDGNVYQFAGNRMWMRQAKGTTSSSLKGLGRLGQAGALPVTNNTLIEASHNPELAAVLGNHPQALLTVPQWNYFYTQASGIVQSVPQHPAGEPGARVNAQTYHDIRRNSGLGVKLGSTLGTIRKSAPGAFPLGGISNGPMRVPFVTPGNRTIFRIPGRGSVPAHVGAVPLAMRYPQPRPSLGRMGVISSGGGNHRWARSPFPRPANWRTAE